LLRLGQAPSQVRLSATSINARQRGRLLPLRTGELPPSVLPVAIDLGTPHLTGYITSYDYHGPAATATVPSLATDIPDAALHLVPGVNPTLGCSKKPLAFAVTRFPESICDYYERARTKSRVRFGAWKAPQRSTPITLREHFVLSRPSDRMWW
jgi:hypothetical protein